jgi:hypothetical protein
MGVEPDAARERSGSRRGIGGIAALPDKQKSLPRDTARGKNCVDLIWVWFWQETKPARVKNPLPSQREGLGTMYVSYRRNRAECQGN